MFDQLPAELRLKTLAYLNVRDLYSAQLVCRSWSEFFVGNESSIYRHAATLHGLSRNSKDSLAEAKSASPRGSMYGVESWKDLSMSNVSYSITIMSNTVSPISVKRRFHIETNWQGHTQPRVKEFRASGDSVHRIKIDADAGYIITTLRRGGLRVTDLYRNEVLWSLPEARLHPSSYNLFI
jgi:hypothetical protein